MERYEALARRIAAQQLDRPVAERLFTDAAILDLGVQDTGRDGASWGLANRGVPVASLAELAVSSELALVWSLRGAPHVYRRADLRGVLDATAPYDDGDARKRTLDASRPLTAAGIGMREAMGVVATTMREVVAEPTTKGELSTALTSRLPEPYLRWCNPCQATHVYEQTFRLAVLAAGLELVPGTSPPVLQRIKGWRRKPALGDPSRAPERLRVVDAYVRLCGPTTPAAVARFVDTPPGVVKEHWPEAAEKVDVDGSTTWALDLPEPAHTAGLVRLLGPFDLYLQVRDRELLLPDRSRHKALWPTIGRPGAVLVGADLVGTWRPRASGSKLALTVDPWVRVTKADRALVDEQAERLATHRDATLTEVVWS